MGQDEAVLTGQDEDRGVIKTEKSEEKEEEEHITAESGSQTGNDAETQQVPGEEEQPARSLVDGAEGSFVSEEDAEDDLGNRCVKTCHLVPLTGLFSGRKSKCFWLSGVHHMF